jgi:hypothetical protein
MAKKQSSPKPKSNQVTVTHSVYHNGAVIKAGSVITKAEAKGIPEQYLK